MIAEQGVRFVAQYCRIGLVRSLIRIAIARWAGSYNSN